MIKILDGDASLAVNMPTLLVAPNRSDASALRSFLSLTTQIAHPTPGKNWFRD
jgi:hypothetical protein